MFSQITYQLKIQLKKTIPRSQIWYYLYAIILHSPHYHFVIFFRNFNRLLFLKKRTYKKLAEKKIKL